MTTNVTIQADIIDIASDSPQQQDIFLVDTNVWLWQTYSKCIPSNTRVQQKINFYTSYLRKARLAGSMLTYSGLALAELAHVIEKTEYEIYKANNRVTLKPKEYRHNHPAERAKVAREVALAWEQVKRLAVPVNLTIDDEVTSASLERFKTQALDGYDLLTLEAISRADPGQVKVITDDIDYVAVPGIQMFTKNGGALICARNQGKLLVR